MKWKMIWKAIPPSCLKDLGSKLLQVGSDCIHEMDVICFLVGVFVSNILMFQYSGAQQTIP